MCKAVLTRVLLRYNVQVIVKSGPGNFYGLAIYADFIYWSDWARRSVLRSNKYTGGDTKVLRADIPHQPMGIIAVARDTNNCEYLDSQRCQTDAALCLQMCAWVIVCI